MGAFLVGLLVFFMGASLTSFFNLLIYRRQRGEEVVFKRSYCEACGQELRPWDLVPLVSYLVRGGRSFCCKERINPAYPLLELGGGLLLVGIFWKNFPHLAYLEALYYLGFYYLALGDFWRRSIYLRDLFLLIGGLVLVGLVGKTGLLHGLPAIFLFLVFFAIQRLFPQAMGEGDPWAGLYLGLMAQNIGEAFLLFTLTFVLAAGLSLVLVALKKASLKTQIPLIPFMFLASLGQYLFS
ncbi:MAG: prepilin peptidase [Tissierellia bacterium]|nr:prepilin peptidase [Tissierellia bacterium]